MIRKCLLLAFTAATSTAAMAGYIVTLQEVDSNVVATGSGPIDFTGLMRLDTDLGFPGLLPTTPLIGNGFPGFRDVYGVGITGPLNFGSGSLHQPDSAAGDITGIFRPGAILRVFVPFGYVSGDPLSNTSTYLNHDFDTLGVTPGTYVWSWGTGPNQNFTLIIEEEASVPIPPTLALLGLGLAGLASTRRKRS